MPVIRPCRAALALVAALLPAPAHAQDRVRLAEAFRPGDLYNVESRVRLTGRLTVPVEPGKPGTPVELSGESRVGYAERLMTADPGNERSVRLYKQMDFSRKTADRPQSLSLRTPVRRVVLMRKNSAEVAFSPDGPLTWGELDLIRTDVFAPALAGLYPDGPVAPGDAWRVREGAVKELTDLETLEAGSLECSLVGVSPINGRRTAQLALRGAVRGVGEDGPTRHSVEGTLYFDLESNFLAYLSLTGTQEMFDEAGKSAGVISGRFTLTRTPAREAAGLSDRDLGGLSLEPGLLNTQLLYENADLGLRFVHPRQWRVGTQRGNQLTLDAAGGGMLLTVDPIEKVPGTPQFQAESRQQLQKFQARVKSETPPSRLTGESGPIDTFRTEAEVGGEAVTLAYYVIRGGGHGLTVAVRCPTRDAPALLADAERILRTVSLPPPSRPDAP